MNTKSFFTWSFLLLLTSVILFSVQLLIIRGTASGTEFFYPVWAVYLFHFLVTFVIFGLLFLISKIASGYVGFAFMGLILFKMIAAVAFLFPVIRLENFSKIPDFISFFIPYFIFLIAEVLLTLKLLKQTPEGTGQDPSDFS